MNSRSCQATSELKGWNAIQHNMRLHDEGMIKDFSDDIDALLAFVRGTDFDLAAHVDLTHRLQAGLFSAVLTAFVVESYQSLNRDYTQTATDVLLRISLQPSNASTPPAVPL